MNQRPKATRLFVPPRGPRVTYLAATVSPGLHQGRGGTQLDGLRLVEDDCWKGFLFQCQDIQFRLQHGLKVLGRKMGKKI